MIMFLLQGDSIHCARPVQGAGDPPEADRPQVSAQGVGPHGPGPPGSRHRARQDPGGAGREQKKGGGAAEEQEAALSLPTRPNQGAAHRPGEDLRTLP